MNKAKAMHQTAPPKCFLVFVDFSFFPFFFPLSVSCSCIFFSVLVGANTGIVADTVWPSG